MQWVHGVMNESNRYPGANSSYRTWATRRAFFSCSSCSTSTWASLEESGAGSDAETQAFKRAAISRVLLRVIRMVRSVAGFGRMRRWPRGACAE